jgi:hypothetical protein
MTELQGKHVFVSYVREDSDAVDSLCAVLEAVQIPFWRDRSALGPGDAWRAKIREAIREGSLVFLACFSDNSRAKDKSYMNEELTLAIEELRKMPPGRTWMIPVRFDDGDVPEWDLGAGRALSDLNYSDLFGPDHMANAARLVTTILRLMGEKRPDPATAMAAVDQATSAGRADLLKRLTKEMLLDPTRQIELDDLVSHEVRRILEVLGDREWVAGPIVGTNDEQVVQVVRQGQELWELCEPFCASLQVAARYGSPELLIPWANGIRSFVAAAKKVEGGNQALLQLRHLPGVAALMTAAMTCTASRKWENLRVLAVDLTVREQYQPGHISLLEATDPYQPFGSLYWVANTMARAATQGMEPTEALKDFTERKVGKYYTPVAEWLHHVLRPLFIDQWPDQGSYDAEWDRAEAILGVLAQDAVNVRMSADPTGRAWGRSHWYGRSTYRAANHRGNAAEDLANEFSGQGSQWGPLQASLFGGDEERAKSALETYVKNFNEIARQRF